ncbi:hypothetical protein EPHNCH_0797 [Anaplasma phagocytophilum str. NCH-1]|uniref:Uncharacterized protein n=1 Tax=Anaplasma phagocytophilum str. NCH-1 TaxID=1359161 RepID=A0A0F3NDG3_ANAPH|nr:hypothetical protein EPHNCH_1636 [Anaplasma phagocytophilum str. NCH-1]KJV65796.1 hypothetical protein EPHNCH_0797 [Anaplasma phagocytophilum str. NCH-1]
MQNSLPPLFQFRIKVQYAVLLKHQLVLITMPLDNSINYA